MKARPVNSMTPQQRRNLRELCNKVLNLNYYLPYAEFDMSRLLTTRGGRQITPKAALSSKGCGTSGCLAGYGPVFGIGKSVAKVCGRSGNWGAYLMDTFGLHLLSDPGGFVFSGKWAGYAPSPEDADLRGLYLLDYGIPDVWVRWDTRTWRKAMEVVRNAYDIEEVAA